MGELHPVPDAQWPKFLADRGLSPKTVAVTLNADIYAPISLFKEALAGDAQAEGEFVHERLHGDGTIGPHPHDKAGGLTGSPMRKARLLALDVFEAIAYGFDVRSFTHWLRWRKGKHYSKALAWFKGKASSLSLTA